MQQGTSEADRQPLMAVWKNGGFHRRLPAQPVHRQAVPLYIADYVLMGYGTGAIMAVPGQDQRDWDFAKATICPFSHGAAAGRLGRRGLYRRWCCHQQRLAGWPGVVASQGKSNVWLESRAWVSAR